MKKLFILLTIFALSGCETMSHHWDQLEPAEKVIVGVGAAVVVGAIVMRNGDSDHITTNTTTCHKHGNQHC